MEPLESRGPRGRSKHGRRRGRKRGGARGGAHADRDPLDALLDFDGAGEQLAACLGLAQLGLLARACKALRDRLALCGAVHIWQKAVPGTFPADCSRMLFALAGEGDADRLRIFCSPVHPECVVWLSDLIHAIDPVSGKSCVFAAAEAGHLDAVRVLCDAADAVVVPGLASGHGCITRTDRPDNIRRGGHNQPYGRSPLWAASSMGHIDVVSELLRRNADVDAVDRDGQTPLWIAARLMFMHGRLPLESVHLSILARCCTPRAARAS